jgi:hypothetical protein
MRPAVVAGVGALLAGLGIVLAVQGHAHGGDTTGLLFLSPEQFDRLQAARRREFTGGVVVAAGVLVLAGLGGWLLGRRHRSRDDGARPASPPVLAVGALGCLLVLAGIAIALTAGAETVTTYSGSYAPLTCPGGDGCTPPAWWRLSGAGPRAGLGLAVVGAWVLAAVAGRLLGDDSRADQR